VRRGWRCPKGSGWEWYIWAGNTGQIWEKMKSASSFWELNTESWPQWIEILRSLIILGYSCIKE
jgi:hypothetical protein